LHLDFVNLNDRIVIAWNKGSAKHSGLNARRRKTEEKHRVMSRISPTKRKPPVGTLNAHPSGDKRFKLLDAAMKRHQYQPDALIEVLHTAQELFGYLEHDLLLYIAYNLRLPPSRVYGVATFYHFFSFTPKGEHSCIVCMGTACYVKGAATLLATLEQQAHVKAGATTADGKLSLLTARCLGACGIAPAVVFDGAVAGNQTSTSALGQTRCCAAGEEPGPCRRERFVGRFRLKPEPIT
jgi:bidirectional [NiFe] hydrogenase diaphorase subunit